MGLRYILYPCVVTAVAVALSACVTSGGGGETASVPPAPQPTAEKSLVDESGVQGSSKSGKRRVYRSQHAVSGLSDSDPNTNKYGGAGKKVAVFETGLYLQDVPEFQNSNGDTRMGEGIGMDGKGFKGFVKSKVPSMYYCKSKDIDKQQDGRVSKNDECDEEKYERVKNTGEHALSVTSAMAGSASGIANRATILAYQVGNFAGSVAYGNGKNVQPKSNYNDAYKHAKDNGVLAINNSYGRTNGEKEYIACLKIDGNDEDSCGRLEEAKIPTSLTHRLVNRLTNDNDKYEKNNNHESRDNPILVYATGNGTGNPNKDKNGKSYGWSEPSLQSRAGEHNPALRRWIIAVGSITSDGRQSKFSNYCGVAQDYCMVALGENVNVLSRTDDNRLKTENKHGTSMATPLVTGAFALLGEKFPDISVQEIRHRLLYTARHTLKNGNKLLDREGNAAAKYFPNPDKPILPTTPSKNENSCISPTGCSNEFGNGALRLDLAMKPVGQSKSAYNGKSLLSAQRQPIKNTKLEASGAFGSGIKHAFNDKVTTVYDALDAPFQHRMSSFVSGGQHNNTYSALALASQDRNIHTTKIINTSGLAYTTDRHDTATQMGFVASSNGVNSILGKHLNYRANVGTMNFITAVEPNDGTLMYGVERMFRYNKTTITPLTKIIYEQNKVLGAKGSATLATTGASTSTFIGMKAQTHIKGIDIYTYAHYGITRTRGDFGVSLQNLNNIESNDFGLSFSKGFETPRNNGKFGVAYSMPLRVTRADATLHYNSGRDKDKNLSYKTEQVDIAPTGKARMIEAFYQTDSKNKPHSLRLHVVHNRDIDHTRGVNATSVGAYYKIKFNSDTIFKNRTP